MEWPGALAIGLAAAAFGGSFLTALLMAICMVSGRISRTEEQSQLKNGGKDENG